MKSPVLYLLEVLFCSGMLLAFYRLLLVRRVAYGYCRRYLVAAMVLSAVIPVLNIPLYPADTVVYPLPLIGRTVAEPVFVPTGDAAIPSPAGNSAIIPATDWGFVATSGAWMFYGLTSLLLAGLFALRIRSIRRLRRRSRLTPCEGYTLAENPEVATPFSFLRTIFIGDSSVDREIVLAHEASHVRRRHSAERIVMECLRCVMWFNPFVWMASRWLQEVQEWEADRDVLDAGYDLTQYRTLLFHQLFGYNPDIACGLNHSLTKNRFAMMTRFKEGRFAFVRLGAAIPVVAGMMLLCSFTTRTPEPSPASEQPQEHPTSTIRIFQQDGKVQMTLNGKPVTEGQLQQMISDWRESLPEEQRPEAVITLKADPQTAMSAVMDVKQAMRKAKTLKINYVTDATEQLRMLPPDPSTPGVTIKQVVPDGVKVAPNGDIMIKERNLLLVQLDNQGQVTEGTPGDLKPASLTELTAKVREFVLNPSANGDLSEQQESGFTLPDGSRISYPVSQGIVSLQTMRNTPYERYVEVQRALFEVYEGIRNDLSQKWFSKPYADLSPAQAKVVMQAVPVKISEAEPLAFKARK